VRLRIIRFGHVLVAARQGQRRDAVEKTRPAQRRCQKNKASAATLTQQEENDSADVQRGGVNISGFLGEKVS
jgi:hypothetical protein